jgi:hypothetical protein
VKFAWPPLLAWTATLAAGTYLRLSGMMAGIVGEEFVANGPGAAYHARRMLATWEHYPAVPITDPLLAWPHGGVPPWPQGFELVGATLALLADDRFGALFLISLTPVLLGLALIGLTAWTAQRLVPDAPWSTPWLAGTLVAILPQSVSVTRFGNPDHHIAEALIMLGLGLWSLAAWRGLAALEFAPRERITIEFTGALLVFVSLANHVATPAYAWIAGFSVVVANFRWGRGHRARWAVGAPGLALGAGCAAWTYLPIIAAHGRPFSYAFPSLLHPLLVLVVSLGCALGTLCGWAWSDRHRRTQAAVVLACALALGAWIPAAREATREFLFGMHEWFGDSEGILAQVTENLPLFHRDAPESSVWQRSHAYYGLFGPLLPLLVPWGLVVHARQVGRRDALPFVVWTLGVTLLMVQQNRFGRIGLVNLALCVTLVLGALAAKFPRARLVALTVPVLAFAVDPAFHFYLRPDPSGPLPGPMEAGVFLREYTPAPVVGRRAGVPCPWDQAFFVVRYGERPVTANNFMPYVARDVVPEVLRIWGTSEETVLRFAERRDLGYVVLGSAAYTGRTVQGRGPLVRTASGTFAWNVDYFRRAPLATLMLGGSGMAEPNVAHLRHLLPRFASTLPGSGLPPSVPDTWVYEIVSGAVVRGTATPGALVRVHTPIARPGHRLVHEAWTTTDADGAFAITTPVPTGYAGHGFATARTALLFLGDAQPRPVSIPESAVRAGTTLSVTATE